MPKNVVQLSSQENQAASDVSESSMLPSSDSSLFIYRSPAGDKLIEALTRSIDEQGTLTIVTGGPGSGKTVLLQRVLQQARPEWELCLIQATHAIGEKYILEQLNNSYYPHQQYKAEALADRLAAEAGERWPVIVVDDAHNLSAFALDILFSLKFNIAERGGRLGLILFATPAIQTMLSSPSLHRHDETIRVIAMPLLSLNETSEYIDQWFDSHGFHMPQGLSGNRKQAIYRRSGGQPGQITRLLTEVVGKQVRVPSALPTRVLHTLGRPYSWVVAAMLLLLVYVLGNFNGPLPGEVPGHAIIAQDQLQLQQPGMPQPAVDKPAPIAITNTAETAARQDNKTTPPTTAPVVKPPASRRAEKPADPTATALPVSPAHPSAELIQDQQIAKNAVVVTTVQEPVDGTDWLLSAKKDDYTIQLAASVDEIAIKRFIRNQPMQEGLSYVHIIRRGKDGYVTLYGSYPTFSRAKQAIADLPLSMRDNGPWIRRISALQALLPAAVTVVEVLQLENDNGIAANADASSSPSAETLAPVPVPADIPVSESAPPPVADDATQAALPDSQPE